MNNKHSHRMTRQRMIILETLKSLKEHPTADELYEIVREKMPRISLGTVYRNLDVLAEMGVIRRLDLDGGQRRFDGNPDRHYHVKCLNCGRLFDLPRKAVNEIEVSDGFLGEIEITGYTLYFHGVCRKCLDTECQQSGRGPDRHINNKAAHS